MKIDSESNKKRRFSSSSFNIIKANLYATPKKTSERMSILNDGSKSVNFISKMNYKSSINENIQNDEPIFNSPTNRRNISNIIIDNNEKNVISEGNLLYL